MAISPPSDLVADVLRAADPAASRAAAARLERLSAATDPSTGSDTGFAERMDTVRRAAPPPVAVPFDPAGARVAMRHGSGADPMVAFEAMVLGRFVSAMMPEEGPAFFGEGPGAGVWRGMLSDALARAMAEGGGVGVAGALTREDPA